MKTYKVKIAWEGVKVGETLELDSFNSDTEGWLYRPLDLAVALHLGFIEEVGAVKKEKFVPKRGDKYYYIDAYGDCMQMNYEYDDYDRMLISIHNCYRTEAEALEARERVLKAY